MDTPLRILVLADSRSFHTARYADELRRQGCCVLLASLEASEAEHHQLKRRGGLALLHYALAASEVKRLVKSFRPDLVNPHFASGYGFTAGLALRRKQVPMMLHLWGSDILIVPDKSFLHRRKTMLALSAADFVLGDSDFILQRANRLVKLSAQETIVWGLEEKYLALARRDYRLGQPLRVIVPRPHEAVYNHEYIIRSLGDLLRSGAVRLTLPDWGSLADEYRRQTKSLDKTSLNFYSKLSRPEFLSLCAEHDVYLSAALSDSSPVSLLEAMGLGLIPVVGDIPGVAEWVTPESGFLFDLSEGHSLRRVLSKLVADDEPQSAMRERNAQRIKREAIFEKNIARTIEIMTKLTSRSRA